MKRTLLDVVQTSCRELNQPIPLTVISSTAAGDQQWGALVGALCEEMLRDYEWEELTKTATIASTGAESYDLPSDFYRMIDNTMWDTSNTKPTFGPKTATEWSTLTNGLLQNGPRLRYRLKGGKIYFNPAPAIGAVIKFEYLSSAYVKDANLTLIQKDLFTQDSDGFLFDDRLVINGVKLKFLETKGFDTAVAFREFTKTLDAVMGGNKGGQTLTLSREADKYLLGIENVPETGFGQ